MAPKIGSVRTAPREVRGANTGRDYIVELTSAGIVIREKSRRGALGPVSYDAIYSLAAKQEVRDPGALRPRRVARSVV
jgi:hypothetical protein